MVLSRSVMGLLDPYFNKVIGICGLGRKSNTLAMLYVYIYIYIIIYI
jgi:hypothetical protein